MKITPEMLAVIDKAVQTWNGPAPEVIEAALVFSGLVSTKKQAQKIVVEWALSH